MIARADMKDKSHELTFDTFVSAHCLGNLRNLKEFNMEMSNMNKNGNKQDQVTCADNGLSMPLEDRKRRLGENETQLKLYTDQILSGKCPIRVLDHEGSIRWDYTLLKESFSSIGTAFKFLTATTGDNLAAEIINKGANALPCNIKGAQSFNIILESLAESAPKDVVEAKLCVQATALYSQGMTYLSRAENSEMICHIEFCTKTAMKLLRLHNETIEALSKYRRGGEQRVVVQHVQVNDGGKAIVGGVLERGGENK